MTKQNEILTVTAMPLPTPYPVGDVNVYLLESGGEVALIDTGVNWARSLDALEAAVAKAGRKIEDIKKILATHVHYDHFGAAYQLSRRSGATVYRFHTAPRFLNRPQAYEEFIQSFLGRCGYSAEYLAMGREFFRKGRRFGAFDEPPAAIADVKDGDEIAVGDARLTAVFTPGHSPEHLCYFERESGSLFSGDFLLPRITPNPLLYFDGDENPVRVKSLLNYINSLETAYKLGATRAAPGHGENIDAPGEAIERNRRFIRERFERFESKLTEKNQSVFDLSVAVFGERDPMNAYLALCETIAYVDLLETEGKAAADWDGEVVSVAKSKS